MSATIHYRVTAKEDPYLQHVGAPSSFIDAMKRAFGSWPCELDSEAIPTLRGMQAVGTFGAGDPYGQIIDLIVEHGSIELYASY